MLWWWSDRLAIAFDHRWVSPLVGVMAVIGPWRSAGDSELVRHRSARWTLGAVTVIAAFGSAFFAFTCFGWRFVGEELSRTTTSTSIGVDVIHIVAQQGISPNTCQYLDLRRGDGLLPPHRLATRCTEADGAVWTVDVDGRALTLSKVFNFGDRVDRWACSYEIDAASLRLRSISDDKYCRDLSCEMSSGRSFARS